MQRRVRRKMGLDGPLFVLGKSQLQVTGTAAERYPQHSPRHGLHAYCYRSTGHVFISYGRRGGASGMSKMTRDSKTIGLKVENIIYVI